MRALRHRPCGSHRHAWLLVICILWAACQAKIAEDPLGYLDKHASDYNTELIDLVNIPSISSLPEHQDDILSAATWLNTRLIQAGLEVPVLSSVPFV